MQIVYFLSTVNFRYVTDQYEGPFLVQKVCVRDFPRADSIS